MIIPEKVHKRIWIGLCCGISLGDKVGSSMVNKLKVFVSLSENNQYEEDENDGGEGILKGADDGTLCGYKYSNERKQ